MPSNTLIFRSSNALNEGSDNEGPAKRAARVAHVEELVEGAQAAQLPRAEVDPFAEVVLPKQVRAVEVVACQVKKIPNREHAAPGRSMVRGSSGEGGVNPGKHKNCTIARRGSKQQGREQSPRTRRL